MEKVLNLLFEHMDTLKDKIRSIPDFPIEHITFRDITTLMQDPEAFNEACDRFYDHYKNQPIDKVVGIEARGFVFGAVLAYRLKVGFVPVRKKGKLPYKTISQTYSLEYGTAEIEMHEDAISPGEKVVIIDDLIATGGTVQAAVKLVEQLGGKVVECGFVIELPALRGRELLKNINIFSMIEFEGD
jgi:adenine phosphoribosyltransferase